MENVRNIEYFKQNVDNIFVCDGDLLKDFDNGTIDIFAHGCNCLNRMGAGIAKTIKEKYPEMYKADTVKYKSIEDQKERTGYDDDKVSHLGDLSCHKFGELKYGFNLYTQVHYFYKFGQKPFRSDALKSAMLKMHNMIKQINVDNKQISVGFPRIGSGLALGDEKEIQQMIFDEFKNSPNIKVYIYDFKP